MAYTKVMLGLDGGTRDDVVRRDRDGAFIPADPRNVDWQAYQAWLAAGNHATAPEPSPPPHISSAS